MNMVLLLSVAALSAADNSLQLLKEIVGNENFSCFCETRLVYGFDPRMRRF